MSTFNKENPYGPKTKIDVFTNTTWCFCENGKNPLTGENCATCGGTGRRYVKEKNESQKREIDKVPSLARI